MAGSAFPRHLTRFAVSAGLLVFTLLGGLTAMAGTAPASGADYLTVDYRFKVLAFGVGEARLQARVDGDVYWTSSKMRTAGLAEVLFKSRYRVVAMGRLGEGDDARPVIIPSRYDSDFEGRSSRKLVSLVFDENGLPGPVAADPPYGKRQLKFPVPLEDQKGTVDPMSSWIHMIMAASADETSPCGRSIPVFDGRRRYDLDLEFVGTENLKVGDVFEGKAHHCRMIYRRVGGFDPEDMDDDELPVPPLETWVGAVKAPSGRVFMVPVQVVADAPIGSVKMIPDRISFKEIEDRLLYAGGTPPEGEDTQEE